MDRDEGIKVFKGLCLALPFVWVSGIVIAAVVRFWHLL